MKFIPYASLIVFLVFRLLLGSIFGVFISSVILYVFMSVWGDVKPFDFPQLILWVDELPNESKTAVFTSLLTILGFLVAFSTARLSWKEEALANLKLNAAEDIELFFNEAIKLSNSAEIYVRSVVEVFELCNKDEMDSDLIFKLKYLSENTQKFFETRERISLLSVESHRILIKHSSTLSTLVGSAKAIEYSTKCFGEISEKIWVKIPHIKYFDRDSVINFIDKVNIDECRAFISSCEKNQELIMAATGGVRGALLAPVVGLNWAAVIYLLSERDNISLIWGKIKRMR